MFFFFIFQVSCGRQVRREGKEGWETRTIQVFPGSTLKVSPGVYARRGLRCTLTLSLSLSLSLSLFFLRFWNALSRNLFICFSGDGVNFQCHGSRDCCFCPGNTQEFPCFILFLEVFVNLPFCGSCVYFLLSLLFFHSTTINLTYFEESFWRNFQCHSPCLYTSFFYSVRLPMINVWFT